MPPAIKKEETPKPVVVGFGHKKGSGKTRAADRLVTEHGFVRCSFADPLRQLALAVNPIIVPGMSLANILSRNRLRDIVDAYGWQGAKDTYPEVRRTLQALGAGVRQLSPTLWVDLAMLKAAASDKPVVFDDVRYPNEAEAIKKAGGIVVLINRPSLESTDTHESELALEDYDGWDRTIVNGDIETFLTEVDAVANLVMAER
jgi:hypothetical protein